MDTIKRVKKIINLCKNSKIWEYRFRFCNKNKTVEYFILKVLSNT